MNGIVLLQNLNSLFTQPVTKPFLNVYSGMDSLCELTQFRNPEKQVQRNPTTSISFVILCREKRKAEFEMYLRRMMKRFSKEVREDTHKVSVTENHGREEIEHKSV